MRSRGGWRRSRRSSSRRRTSNPGRAPRSRARTTAFGWVTDETRDYIALNGLELWAYSPLIQGSFDRDDRPFPQAYDHPGTTGRLSALAEVAGERGVPRARSCSPG